jgi:ABC-type multidrug transport system fused ATPase/permease subunit
MNDKQIVESGTLAELIENKGPYFEMFEKSHVKQLEVGTI